MMPVLARLEALHAASELAAEQVRQGLEKLGAALRHELHQQDRQRLRQLEEPLNRLISALNMCMCMHMLHAHVSYRYRYNRM